MASHQTIVVELGSSRIKVGFAGEPRPRRVLFDDSAKREGGGWTVNVNDGMVSRACHWPSFFHYYSPSCTAAHGVNANGSVSLTTSHDWEKTLFLVFAHTDIYSFHPASITSSNTRVGKRYLPSSIISRGVASSIARLFERGWRVVAQWRGL